MTISRQPMDEAGRKRHLEALFADEPYLSPTMKARRMHEKLNDPRSRDVGFGDRLSVDSPFAGPVSDDPAFMRYERTAPPGSGMSLLEAKKRLGSQGVPDPFAFSPSDPISYFRTQVLSQWIRKVDRREI